MAIKEYEKAIKSYKKSIILYTEKNYRKVSAEQSIEAAKSFKFSAIYSISECYLKLNQLDSAQKYIKLAENTALKMQNPEFSIFAYSQVSVLKGEIAFFKNETDKAISHYNEAINLWAGNNPARYKRAMIFLAKNTPEIEKYQVTNATVTTSFDNFEYRKITTKKYSEPSKIELSQALSDCDFIIKQDSSAAKVYLLRAILKKEIGYFNYCSDIQKAIELGIPEANKIANLNCKI